MTRQNPEEILVCVQSLGESRNPVLRVVLRGEESPKTHPTHVQTPTFTSGYQQLSLLKGRLISRASCICTQTVVFCFFVFTFLIGG